VIAIEVFKKEPDFDSSTDSTVRVEIGRLRNKLREYYSIYGIHDAIEINLPKGRYQVNLINRETQNRLDDQNIKKFRQRGRVNNPKLAILPFTCSAEIEKSLNLIEELDDNLVFELIDLPSIYLISRQSSSTYPSGAKSLFDISNALGAQYLVEGSVQSSADEIRIVTRLYSQSKDSYIWTERFCLQANDSKSLCRQISNKIHKVILDEILPIDDAVFGVGDTSNPSAQQLLMQGMELFWKYTHRHIQSAKELFLDALAKDRDYMSASAWMARAIVYEVIIDQSCQPEHLDEKLRNAHSYALNALESNPNAPYALSVLGWVNLWLKKPESAVSLCRKAVINDPNNTESLSFLSMVLSSTGDLEESLIYAKHMKELNPFGSHINMYALGLAYFANNYYEDAIAYFYTGCNLNNTFLPNHLYLSLCYAALDMKDELQTKRNEVLCMIAGDHSKLPRSHFIDNRLYGLSMSLRQKAGFNI
jgi:TolB-like protein/Tfp pilus assembly protein PilF